jgi:putative restriction endonuclease
MKADGTTSKGAFGRSVRLLSDAEFEVILRAGFSRELEPWEQPATGVAEPSITYAARPLTKQVVTRPFRDQQLRLPTHPEWYPHPSYLKWHREHVFKG